MKHITSTLLLVAIITGIISSPLISSAQEMKGASPVKKEQAQKMMKKEKKKKEMKKDMMKEKTMTSSVGSSYAAYKPELVSTIADKKIVLFFHASWCPSCQTIDKDILKNITADKNNLVILDVNYDDSQKLKEKYGVTYQHTFVQIDNKGNKINKWSGGATLSDLVSNLK